MPTTRYRKKPIETDAIQFTGDNVEEIWDAFGAAGIYGPTETNPDYLILTTVHGDQAPARAGDWIIPDGAPGTFYPCKPDIFAATYEPVTEPNIQVHIEPDPPHIAKAIADIRRHGLPPITRH